MTPFPSGRVARDAAILTAGLAVFVVIWPGPNLRGGLILAAVLGPITAFLVNLVFTIDRRIRSRDEDE